MSPAAKGPQRARDGQQEQAGGRQGTGRGQAAGCGARGRQGRGQRLGAGRRPPVSAKLMIITVNCAYEHHRRGSRVTYTDDLEPLAGGAEDRHDFTLWDAVCRLPADYRVATVLYYYEDMTTAEIAKALGVREGTVRSRLSRARSRLRTLLEEE